jgi:hypothetical protein
VKSSNATRKNGWAAIRRALLPLGLAAFSLLAGCTTEDEPEYNIPARLQVVSARLEAGPDGSPLVFAEIGMIYGTATPEPHRQRYGMRNIQCIAYTKGSGGWKAHSFRNLQSPNGASSYLLRNANGEWQPLIRDFNRLVLYAFRGDAWVAKKSVAIPDGRSNGVFPLYYGNEAMLGLVGDSAWQAPEERYDASTLGRLAVWRSDGTGFLLDTSSGGYGSSLMLSGKRWNYLVKMPHPGLENSEQDQHLLCYRWSHDPAGPKPRKQILEWAHPPKYGALLSAFVSGESHVYYVIGTDSLAEFGLRDDTLAFLGYRSFPAENPPEGNGTSQPVWLVYHNVGVDPGGCLHSLSKTSDTGAARSPGYYLHRSSCQERPDTLRLPDLGPGYLEAYPSGLRWDADGNPMVGFSLIRHPQTDGPVYLEDPPPPPSWIFLARRGPGMTWTWEKIAEF